ncbi:hypothetical protein [Microtetraspora niveoalba]|uniref:hypothetical protein n=1 Tax=Microtetraspora niveoalba TaxID=46175 RepID=UPI00082955C4|nr:hypothetical protein [Microtetraspora niveoalba]
MPDWTYQPLRGIAAALLGADRSRRWALRALATVGSLPGGGFVVARAFGHRHPPSLLAGTVAGVPVRSRLGAVVPPRVARDAVRALPPLGAGLVEVAPVGEADVPLVVKAAEGRRVPVVARAEGPDVARMLAPYVDGFTTGADPGVVRLTSPSVGPAVEALADPTAVVLAAPPVLVGSGPGWFARVAEAVTPTSAPPPVRKVGGDLRRWPAWWWAFLVGAGLVVAGVGAALITMGPVLLWYDRAFLGMGTERLQAINRRLVGFLQHDRITMAGTMVAVGVLYAGLAMGGMRRGWPWAREALTVSGWILFPASLSSLRWGFVEPLHAAVVVVLFPMFVMAVRRRTAGPGWTARPEGPRREWRAALLGQLLMVGTGAGLLVGGVAVSAVGVTDVFVRSDLEYLGTGPEALHAAGPGLLPFVAHDRAGFGGALTAAAVAITLVSAWGWRRGESWVWWSLALAAAAGFVPAVVVHGVIEYSDFGHLAPVFAGVGLTVTALILSRPYLCARPRKVRRPPDPP